MDAQVETQATDEVDLQIETLTGDIRDSLLTHVRSMGEPWQWMTEDQQADKIHAVSAMADTLVRRAAQIIATRGFNSVMITVGKITVTDKGEVKSEVSCPSITDSVVHLMNRQNRPSLLILVDPDDYAGERQEAKPTPDQPDLIDGE